jgi:hypothetical protein
VVARVSERELDIGHGHGTVMTKREHDQNQTVIITTMSDNPPTTVSGPLPGM